MSPSAPLGDYLKSCSDREYAEYIIATMTRGNSPLDFDKEQKEAIESIRSRPAPSPEEVNPWCYPGCILIDRAKKDAAARAREKFAKTIRRKLSKLKSNNGSASDFVWWEVIDVVIDEVNEYLRTGGKP